MIVFVSICSAIKPKLYSVNRIANFANVQNNNSQLNFHAQNYFKVLLR